MSNDQREHSETIRRTKQRRLQVLENQAALRGFDTAPHILIEIEDLRRELNDSASWIDPPSRSTTKLRRLSPIHWGAIAIGIVVLLVIATRLVSTAITAEQNLALTATAITAEQKLELTGTPITAEQKLELTGTPITAEQKLELTATAIAQRATSADARSGTIIYTKQTSVTTEPFGVKQFTDSFIASVRLYVPATDDGKWSYGLIFWDGGCRIILGDNQGWVLQCGEGRVTGGKMETLVTAAGGYNDVTLVVDGANGILIVNEDVIAELELPESSRATGDVSIGWGWGPMTLNTSLKYDNFTVRVLPQN